MKTALLIAIGLLLLTGPAEARTSHTKHYITVSLASGVRFQIRLAGFPHESRSVAFVEYVDHRELTVYEDGSSPWIWFFGRGVSGRYIQRRGDPPWLEAINLGAKPVVFTVRWSRYP